MKRLPIIRHIRWFYLHSKFLRWWNSEGKYLGSVPNEEDMQFLNDVWDGKA